MEEAQRLAHHFPIDLSPLRNLLDPIRRLGRTDGLDVADLYGGKLLTERSNAWDDIPGNVLHRPTASVLAGEMMCIPERFVHRHIGQHAASFLNAIGDHLGIIRCREPLDTHSADLLTRTI